MRTENIIINLKEKDERTWQGEVYDGNTKVTDVIGIFSIRENTTFEGQDPRSIMLVTPSPKGEKGDLLGFLNFKETKNGSYKIFCRELKIPNTTLCFPVDGWLNISDRDNKQQVQLKQDNYYLKNQKQHWEGKRNYVFHDSTVADDTPTEEIPF